MIPSATLPRPPVTLIVVLVAIRLLTVALLVVGIDLNQDEEYYDEIARNLLAGRGFTHDVASGPNLWRDPVYPLFLAGLMPLPLRLSVSAPLAQTVLDAGTSWLTFLLFRPVGHRVAVLAAVLTWVNPLLTYYSLRFLSESLFTFLLISTLLTLYRGATSGTTLRAAAGTLCGAAILCRRSLIGFPVLAALWLAGRSRGGRRLWGPAVFIVAILFTVSPWLLRNLTVSGHLTLGTGAAYNFWLGNHQPTQGRDIDQLAPPEARMLEETIHHLTRGRSRFEPEVGDAFAEAAWAEIRSSPMGFVTLLGRKFLRFWFEVYGSRTQGLQPLLVAFQAGFLAACLAGLFLGWSTRRVNLVLPLLAVGYLVTVHTLTVATVRYMVPLYPILSGLAALSLEEGWAHLRGALPERHAGEWSMPGTGRGVCEPERHESGGGEPADRGR